MPIAETLQPLSTIKDFIRWGSSEFARRQLVFGHGFESARDEARYLVLHALALPHDWPEEDLNAMLTLPEREQVVELLQARIDTRRPAAYLTGESWFCGLRFKVDERVLVPRSPIAELIGNRFEPWIDSGRVSRILDLCTGSGCIAIAARYQFPDAQVAASDISGAALEVAADNLEMHGLADHIELYESDLFASIPDRRFDVIVCNPPYVDAEDMAALDEEFSHEPELGLRAGQDGLAVVDRILAAAGDFLDDDGVIFIEVGNSATALQQKYEFLPLVWIEFEFGGGGVCCIDARDLKRQRDAITALAS